MVAFNNEKNTKAPTTNIGYNNKKNAITNISATKKSQNNGNGIASSNEQWEKCNHGEKLQDLSFDNKPPPLTLNPKLEQELNFFKKLA